MPGYPATMAARLFTPGQNQALLHRGTTATTQTYSIGRSNVSETQTPRLPPQRSHQNMICLELGYGSFGKSVFTVSPKTATQTTGLAYSTCCMHSSGMGRPHLYGSSFRAQLHKLGSLARLPPSQTGVLPSPSKR